MACLFCQIIEREIPSDIVFEDDQLLAFNDIAPQAPTHILLIPKRHIATLNDLGTGDEALMGHLVLVAQQLAAERGLSEDGYRLAVNCNHHGGQSVYHIHLHLMGGRQMSWPPG